MEKKSLIQALKFTLFSISAGLIQIGSFALLNEVLPIFNQEYGLNYLVALLLSILWNFTFNRKFTFKADGNVKKAMLLVLLFYAVFTPTTVLLGQYFANLGVNEYLILGVTMVSNFILEFIYTKFVVYPEPKEELTTQEKPLNEEKLMAEEARD